MCAQYRQRVSFHQGDAAREEGDQDSQTSFLLPSVHSDHFDLSRVLRAGITLLVVLLCLFVVGTQIILASVIWFLGLVVPLQPWSSLLLDCLAVLVGLGGPFVLMQPLLRLRPSWKRWVVGSALHRAGVTVLLVVEVGAIIGELLAVQLPGYWWGDLVPLLWMFPFFVLLQFFFGHASGFLSR